MCTFHRFGSNVAYETRSALDLCARLSSCFFRTPGIRLKTSCGTRILRGRTHPTSLLLSEIWQWLPPPREDLARASDRDAVTDVTLFRGNTVHHLLQGDFSKVASLRHSRRQSEGS